MHNLRIVVLWCLTGAVLSSAQVRYFKGNTHSHTNKGGDSQYPSAECIADYAKRGYDFLVLAEHDSLTHNEHLSNDTLLLINGQEVTGVEAHFTSLNATSTVGEGFFTNPYDPGTMISLIKEAGGIPVLNHPRWRKTPLNFRKIIDMDVRFIEIYNFLAEEVSNDHDDLKLWDSLLTADKVMYGIASDDSHVKSQIGHGWIMVRARTLHRDSILASMMNGDFYASTGVELNDVGVMDDELYVDSKNGAKISFITDRGKVLKIVQASSARIDLDSVRRYVRAVVSDTLGRMAWTQPYFPKKRNIVITSAHPAQALPQGIDIEPNFPNPFNGATRFRFTLDAPSVVSIRIYSVLGEQIGTVTNGHYSAGSHVAQWEPRGVPSGLFIARFSYKQQDGIVRSSSMKLLYLK